VSKENYSNASKSPWLVEADALRRVLEALAARLKRSVDNAASSGNMMVFIQAYAEVVTKLTKLAAALNEDSGNDDRPNEMDAPPWLGK
jgi:hypothetical protein